MYYASTSEIEALESLPICSRYAVVKTLGKTKPYYKNFSAYIEKPPKNS